MSFIDRVPSGSPLATYGYQIFRHAENFNELKKAFEEILGLRLAEFSGKGHGLTDCETYHTTLDQHAIDHHAFLKATRRDVSMLISHPYIQKLIAMASELTQSPVGVFGDKIEYRVCRPNQADANDFHRDHWFPYFKPLINVYVPLSSSFCDSAMQIVPFSHQWSDEECTPTFEYDGVNQKKTEKNGILYSVPEIKDCRYDYRALAHRPDIVPGDFALFSPCCIHGNGTNTSANTRFSLEFRLELQ